MITDNRSRHPNAQETLCPVVAIDRIADVQSYAAGANSSNRFIGSPFRAGNKTLNLMSEWREFPLDTNSARVPLVEAPLAAGLVSLKVAYSLQRIGCG